MGPIIRVGCRALTWLTTSSESVWIWDSTAKARHTKFTFLPHSKYRDSVSKSAAYHNGCLRLRSRGLATRRWKSPTKCVAFGLILCASIAHNSLGPQFTPLSYTILWAHTLHIYRTKFLGRTLWASIAHNSLAAHFVPLSYTILWVHTLHVFVQNSLAAHFGPPSHTIPWAHALCLHRTQFLGCTLCASIAHNSLGSHFVPL
jgi:hypothetical protein